MTMDEQLAQWLAAKPVHIGICCPDFSCCNPKLLAPLHEREEYMMYRKTKNKDGLRDLTIKFVTRFAKSRHKS